MKKIWKKLKSFENDKFGMIILMTWFWFIVCFIIKLLGFNWFVPNVESEKFISLCKIIDNIIWLKMFLACIIYLASGYLILCVMLNEKKLCKSNVLIFFPIMIIKSLLNWYFPIISFILDIFILLVLTTIINKNFKRNIICFLLISLFQIITIVFKDMSFNFNYGNTFLEQTIYQIDYYLMIILFYLYNFKKQIKKNWSDR